MKTNIINESIRPVDPTIVKTPNTLRSEVLNLLNTRIGDEYAAAQLAQQEIRHNDPGADVPTDGPLLK